MGIKRRKNGCAYRERTLILHTIHLCKRSTAENILLSEYQRGLNLEFCWLQASPEYLYLTTVLVIRVNNQNVASLVNFVLKCSFLNTFCSGGVQESTFGKPR